MLSSLGYPEMGVLLLFGLFLFGPERLPGMAKELGKLLRQVRAYGKSVRDDLASEMGPEFGDLDLRTLNPKTFVRKHLLEDEPATPVLSSPPANEASTYVAPGVPAPSAALPDAVSLDKTAVPEPPTRSLPPPAAPAVRTRFRDPA